MRWNWQKAEWPSFDWDADALNALEARFAHETGILLGMVKHVSDGDKIDLIVELISTEAVKTSEIESEILDRGSVQSSLRRNFGLSADDRRATAAERGVAEMMTDLYRAFDDRLSHRKLCAWHGMLMAGRPDLVNIGSYRTHEDAMQVVSGAPNRSTIHFEAPPSSRIPAEMNGFIDWFNASGPVGGTPLPPLTRAGLAHLYFVCIHPFEDGNGRIGRAVSEMALSQSLKQPALLALSQTIQSSRKLYYDMLEKSNKALEVTPWLEYFAATVLQARDYSIRRVEFLIAKTKLLDGLRGRLNSRQEKALARMLRAGPDGFIGGMSADNYRAVTGASTATATRDLAGLVRLGAFTRTGERRHTRYWLKFAGNGE